MWKKTNALLRVKTYLATSVTGRIPIRGKERYLGRFQKPNPKERKTLKDPASKLQGFLEFASGGTTKIKERVSKTKKKK